MQHVQQLGGIGHRGDDAGDRFPARPARGEFGVGGALPGPGFGGQGDGPAREIGRGGRRDGRPARLVEQSLHRGRGGADRRRFAGPEALALERVGRQVGHAPRAQHRGPVDGDPVGGEVGDRGQQGRGLVAVAAQRGGGHDGGVPCGGEQDAVRAELHEAGETTVGECGEAVGEADGLADVADPVVSGDRVVGHRAGEVGDQRQARGPVGDRLGDGAELVEHGLHARRVEGVTDGEPLGPVPVGGEPVGRRQHRVLVAGEDDGGRPVDRRDVHVRGELRPDPVLGRLHGHHRAAGRQRGHQAGTGRHQPARVVEVEHPGDVRGGEFTDGMAEQRGGSQAPVLQLPGERHLQREQRGLGVPGVVEQPAGIVAERDLADRGLESRCDLVEGGGEDREGGVQLAASARALAALAGEEEDRPARARLGSGDRREGVERVGVCGDDGSGAVVEPGPGGGQGPGHVRERGLGGGAEVVGQPCGLGTQSRRSGCAERQRDGAGGGRRVRGGGRGLLQDGVRVGAADAERGHRRATGPLGPPVTGFGEQPDPAGRPVDVRGRLVGVQGRREDTVAEGEDGLDDPGHARRRLGVAEVGLDRPEPGGLGPVLPVGRQQRLGLDRVTEGGAGAVGLDDVHVGGVEAGVGECGADDPLLRRSVGGGHAVGGTVGVDRGAAQHGEHGMAVALGVGETFEQQDARALTESGAVGTGGERLRPAVGGQAALAGEVDEQTRGRQHGRATRQCQVALAAAQCPGSEMQRDEGRRAGRVDGDGGAFETEDVVDPPRRHAARARAQMALHLGESVRAPEQARGVVLAHQPGEHAGAAAAQPGGFHPGPLQRLPDDLQQEALLRVGGQCLARGDAEERGVELGGVVEETAFTGGAGARAVSREQALGVPATVRGERTDDVPPLGDQLPQLFGGADAAGVAAGHRHDGDRLAVAGRRGDGPGASAVLPGQLGEQVPGDGGRRRMVEDQRGGQAQCGGGREPVAQLDGGQ